jgi:hypothetical protein
LVTVDPKVAVPPGCSCCVPEVSETDTVNDGTVIVAKADFVGSLTEVATRLTVNWLVAVAGGVYVVGMPVMVDVGETAPQAGAGQVTVQLTTVLDPPLVTVAVNCTVAPTSTVAVSFDSEMLMGGFEPQLLAAIATRTIVARSEPRFGESISVLPRPLVDQIE